MPPAAKEIRGVELLPKENWEKGSLGRVFTWLLTTGRKIVIFTELLVILAFLSRFKLDRDLTDLNESLKQKQAIIQSSATFEKRFRQLQNQLTRLAELQRDQSDGATTINEIAQITPIDVYLDAFNWEEKAFKLNATALSEAGLSTLIQNLKKSPQTQSLRLTQIQANSSKQIGFKFELQGEFKP